MDQTALVVQKILAMFLVLLVGYVARRRRIIDEAVGRVLVTFTTDVALPALIFVQMLKNVDRQALAGDWPAAVMACAVLALGALIGWLSWRAFCTKRDANVFIFVVAVANWIYLPLPIVEGLYHGPGVRVLLLGNAGVQVLLWTAGVAILRGGRVGREAIVSLAKNAGMIATVAGVVVALFAPKIALPGWCDVGWRSTLEAMDLVGSLTVPLSLVVIGVQLGSMSFAAVRPGWSVIGVIFLRLLVAPAVAGAMMLLALRLGVHLNHVHVMVMFLVSAMPVAISCSIMADRFANEGQFAAKCIFYTTLASVVTVPAVFWAFQHIV